MIPSSATAMEKIVPAIRSVDSSFFRLSWSFAPKQALIMTPAPMHSPDIPSMRMFITGPAIPVAARASVPMKRPAIMESTAL